MSGQGGPPEYDFTDTSLVRPLATRVYFTRMFRLVPRWLAANLITLLGFGATGAMFVLAVASQRVEPTVLALASFLALQVYAVADHLDGMQALAAGTAAPLGEFLDHFSDSVSGMFVAFVAFELMPGVSEWVRASVLVLYLLAFIATYQERAERGRLHFARFGALEGIIIISAFLLTSAFPWGRAFWNGPLAVGIPGYALVVAVAYAVFAGTVALMVLRMGGVPRPFLLHAVASAVLATAATLGVGRGALDSWLAWALVCSHGAAYLATAMQPHLFGGRARFDGVALGLALALAAAPWVLGLGWTQVLALGTLGRLAMQAVRTVYVVLHAYRDGWVWVNPSR